MHVFFASTTTELLAEGNVLEIQSQGLRVPFDLLQSSHLTWPYDLVLVE